MNREQQRFELIKHLAGAAMPSEGFNLQYKDWPKIKGDLAKCCVEIADALLAELDRTKPEPETNNLLTVIRAYFGERFETEQHAENYIVQKLTDDPRIPSPPQTDADGWIPHVPGDPMPCDGESTPHIKFRDGEILRLDKMADTADNYSWGADEKFPDFEIIAWKPA